MPNWEYIIIHTAAHGNGRVNRDTTAKEINEWHTQQGWHGIGYHFVVRLDGTVENGRSLYKFGAHAKGLNSRAIGICCSGHGDFWPLTPEQLLGLCNLLDSLKSRFHIPLGKIIGHRDVNALVDSGVLGDAYRTSKSCPGICVSMDLIRKGLKP